MVNESKKILSEISAGELLDKISILEIKLDKIKDKTRNSEIKKEYEVLKKIEKSYIESNDKIKKLIIQIKDVNLALWDIEDEIRICEKNKNFDKNFIKLARSVYITNDKRAKIKSEINEILKSNIKEVKARNGLVVALVNESDNNLDLDADYLIKVPEVSSYLAPIINVIPLQFLSYYIALNRGCDIDQPRNLAKSVTVE